MPFAVPRHQVRSQEISLRLNEHRGYLMPQGMAHLIGYKAIFVYIKCAVQIPRPTTVPYTEEQVRHTSPPGKRTRVILIAQALRRSQTRLLLPSGPTMRPTLAGVRGMGQVSGSGGGLSRNPSQDAKVEKRLQSVFHKLPTTAADAQE